MKFALRCVTKHDISLLSRTRQFVFWLKIRPRTRTASWLVESSAHNWECERRCQIFRAFHSLHRNWWFRRSSRAGRGVLGPDRAADLHCHPHRNPSDLEDIRRKTCFLWFDSPRKRRDMFALILLESAKKCKF